MKMIGLFGTLVIIIMIFPSCRKATEEDRVKKVVSDVQKAAGNKAVMSIIKHVSKSYRDPEGRDYDGIKGLLAFYFFRHRKVSVFVPAIDVKVDGDSAQAVFQAILSGRYEEGGAMQVLPDSLGVYKFEVSLVKEEGHWKVKSAKWERAEASKQGLMKEVPAASG